RFTSPSVFRRGWGCGVRRAAPQGVGTPRAIIFNDIEHRQSLLELNARSPYSGPASNYVVRAVSIPRRTGDRPEPAYGAGRWVGTEVFRKEDEALLTGRARFIDDIAPVPGLKHAAILRSPHPHARLGRIDVERALALPGVVGVVTGAQLAQSTVPVPSVVKAPVKYFPCAVEKVRYVGEPVAVVVADSRYLAEDALDLIDVEYEPLPA